MEIGMLNPTWTGLDWTGHISCSYILKSQLSSKYITNSLISSQIFLFDADTTPPRLNTCFSTFIVFSFHKIRVTTKYYIINLLIFNPSRYKYLINTLLLLIVQISIYGKLKIIFQYKNLIFFLFKCFFFKTLK